MMKLRFGISTGLRLFRNRPLQIHVRKTLEGACRTLWVDVTRTSKSGRLTGIERVVREVSAAIVANLPADGSFEVRFFALDILGRCVEVQPAWINDSRQPAQTSGAKNWAAFGPEDVLFFLDLSLPPLGLNEREINFLRSRGVKLVYLVYDVLPVTRPDLFPPGKSHIFQEWLGQVTRSDSVLFISGHTQTEFARVTSSSHHNVSRNQNIIPLASSDLKLSRKSNSSTSQNQRRGAIAIGTLEPRKDYPGLISAMDLIWASRPDFSLTIVGRPGWQGRELVRQLRQHPRFGSQLIWEGQADDSRLSELLSSRQILVANSIDEGFGLPLIEGAAQGLSVVARDIPVFREVFPNACFFDAENPSSMRMAILRAELGQCGIATRKETAPLAGWGHAARAVWRAVQETLTG